MKQLVSALLAVALLAGLGCGGSSEKGKNSAKDDRPRAADKAD